MQCDQARRSRSRVWDSRYRNGSGYRNRGADGTFQVQLAVVDSVSGPAKFCWTVGLLGLEAEMDLGGPVSLGVAMVLNTRGMVGYDLERG